MAVKQVPAALRGYGLDNALQDLAPQPIIAQRAPGNNDTAQLGTLWINKPANLAYVLTSVVAGIPSWVLLEGSGGSGVFTSLTVTPGPVSLTGTTNINTSGSGVTTIGTGGTGAVNIGNATGGTAFTGTTTLAAMTQVGTANINASGAATTNIATGGTGALNLGNATGNTTMTGLLTAAAFTQAGVANINTTGTATTTIGNVGGATAVVIHSGTAGTTITSTGTGSGAITVDASTAASGGVLVALGGTLGATSGLNILQGANAASIQVGSGAPSHAASQGTLYLNHAGSGTADRLYVNTNGSTGWTNFVSAA